jgi:hypothetical protein
VPCTRTTHSEEAGPTTPGVLANLSFANSPMPELDSQPAAPADAGPDPLASLKKMSATAGAGTQDYVAINTLAIVAALLGVASVLVFFSDVLLVVPAVGIVCAAVAWRQIRGSNGTQAGVALAGAGFLLSLLLGGGSLVSRAVSHWTAQSEEQAINALVRQIGQDVAAAHYPEAYAHFTDSFRSRVPESDFREKWELIAHTATIGRLRSMESNGRTEFEGKNGAGIPTAWTGVVPKFETAAESPRWVFRLSKINGTWQVDEVPEIFKSKPRAGRAGAK